MEPMPGIGGFGSPKDQKPFFWIGTRDAPNAAVHVAFGVDSRELVDAFHAAALEAGGTDNGEPGAARDLPPATTTARSSTTPTATTSRRFATCPRGRWVPMADLLDDDAIDERLGALDGWCARGRRDRKEFKNEDFVGSVKFVDAVVEPAEEMGHHPDLEISWDTVKVSITNHAAGGLTEADFELAGRIDGLAG